MADEFVDFYEILELPLDAERSDVRKRINELYVEAQKNLDHRNFDIRVRNQQMFEFTLPQARYILLDAGRRNDYDRLVQDSRAPVANPPVTDSPVATPERAAARTTGEGAGARMEPPGIPGETPSIDALPDEASDPETVAREREEMWSKWKTGLQGAMEREAAKDKNKPTGATTPLADRIEAAETGAPQPRAGAESVMVTPGSPPPAINAAAPEHGKARAQRSERPKVNFDFDGGNSAPNNAARQGEDAAVPGAAEFAEAAKGQMTPAQVQERRDNHRRVIMKGELENTGLKGLFIGAGAVLLPGVIFMTMFMSTYYPPNEISTLPIKSAGLAWLLWLLVLGGVAYLCAYFLSKSLRRRQATELAMMSYEDLLRHTNKDI